jgi:hypothetical protein
VLSRVLSLGIAAVIATTGLTFSAAAEGVGGSAGAEELLLAQAGYDPLRRAKPSEVPTRPEANPELGGLPDAPGAEETFYLCSACHSIALVKQQRLTDERWDYLWTWMTTEQGMPEQEEETRLLILGYLKEYFSSER